jgi:hypothetical protein
LIVQSLYSFRDQFLSMNSTQKAVGIQQFLLVKTNFGPQRVWRQDKLIGGKPPVVKCLGVWNRGIWTGRFFTGRSKQTPKERLKLWWWIHSDLDDMTAQLSSYWNSGATIPSKRRPHFETRLCLGKNRNLGHRSPRRLKSEKTLLAKATSNFTGQTNELFGRQFAVGKGLRKLRTVLESAAKQRLVKTLQTWKTQCLL